MVQDLVWLREKAVREPDSEVFLKEMKSNRYGQPTSQAPSPDLLSRRANQALLVAGLGCVSLGRCFGASFHAHAAELPAVMRPQVV